MRGYRISVGVGLWALLILLSPAAAGAQNAGSIAGTVKDATGGVLPGVTVEASSPVLIEKTRSVVSDGEGQYKIINLPPGTYSVTFTLPGFNTVKRDGIELTGGFAANVNGELKVGSVEETITVSGETPVVDVQNTKQQAVMSREVLDAIPAGGQVQNVGILIPGASPAVSSGAAAAMRDVGGLMGQTQVGLSLHGGRGSDQQQQVDGFPTYNWVVLNATSYSFVETDFQEYVFDTGNNSPETETGGVRINLIPREGGNAFKLNFNGSYSPTSLAPVNLDDALKAKGLTAANTIKRQYFAGGSLGGPIFKDRLWFFAAATQQDNEYYVANSYYNACLPCWTYTEDKSRQAYFNQRVRDYAVRGTWQASPRNKVSTFWGGNNFLNGHQSLGGATKEETVSEAHNEDWYYIGTWQSPVTNRLLLEAGVAASPQDQPYFFPGALQGRRPEPAITDSGFNINYRTSAGGTTLWWNRNAALRTAVSYVTGSHAFKLGFYGVRGALSRVQIRANDCWCSLQAVSGVPSGVTYYGDPVRQTNGVVSPQLAFYGQDQWTTKKLTVNAGVRYDHYHGYLYAQNNPPTKWVLNARNIPEIDGMHWNDLSPRLGVVYDLFGDGKTAIKGSVNRYVQGEAIATVQQLNPLQGNNSVTRKWTDTNGDHVVQGNPYDTAANGELGASTNLKFGQPAVSLRLDPAWQNGFNIRPANWEYSAAVQQELRARVSVNVAYFRRRFVNFVATENQAVSPSDYDQFCVTTPIDARLPNGGGQQLCGLYDVKLTKVGLIDDVRTFASNYGNVSEHWQGFDFTVNARPKNILLQGGISTGKTVTDVCGAMTGHPNIEIATPKTDLVAAALGLSASGRAGNQTSTAQPFCHAETPWLTDAKFVASYTLPYAVTVATTYQDAPGPQVLATGTFTNAQIQPSLGRALGGAANRVVSMVPIGTLYVQRLHQLDLRFGRTFKVGRANFKTQLDVYNALNANPIVATSSVYGLTAGATTGAAWQVPQGILTARLTKIGVQIDF